MHSSKRTPRSRKSTLYDAVLSRCDHAMRSRFLNLFDKYQIESEGTSYRVGSVVRDAWRKECDIPNDVIDDLYEVIEDILAGRGIAHHPSPACCEVHRNFLDSFFASPADYPDETELLGGISRALWALLPAGRGSLRMKHNRGGASISMSHFMVLNYFIRRHDRDYNLDLRNEADAKKEYIAHFNAAADQLLRRARLKRDLSKGTLLGFVGGITIPDPAKLAKPRYCEQRRPFSTPTRGISASERSKPPDNTLRSLGLEFDKSQDYVELVFQVSFDKAAGKPVRASSLAAAPTIIDAGGYWLFRPDRARNRSDGLLWNYTRSIPTDERGRRELISRSLPIDSLTDLIVWPSATLESWPAGAARCLIDGSYAVS